MDKRSQSIFAALLFLSFLMVAITAPRTGAQAPQVSSGQPGNLQSFIGPEENSGGRAPRGTLDVAHGTCLNPRVIPVDSGFASYSNTDSLDVPDNQDPGSCPGAPRRDVFYEFTPIFSGNYEFLLCGGSPPSNPLQFQIDEGGCCPGGSQITTECSPVTPAVLNLTGGVAYTIEVGSQQDGLQFVYTFSITRIYPAPSNDDCAGAILVSIPSQTSSNNLGATDDTSPNCGETPSPIANGVWYRVVGTGNRLYASTCNPVTNLDTKIAIYQGPCGSLACRGDDDDDPGCASGATLSTIEWNSSAGVTYYILVAGSTEGNFRLDISEWGRCCYNSGANCLNTDPQTCASGFSGQWTGSTLCEVSLCPLPCTPDFTLNAPGTVSGNTCGAGNDCIFRSTPDQVIQINFPTAGSWTISLCGVTPIWDSVILLTTECCGGTTIEADDDDCGGFNFSRIPCENLAAGTYYLAVEGFSGTTCGAYTVDVARCGRCCADNGTCANGTQADCDASGGYWTPGDCASGACIGRCCYGANLCADNTKSACDGLGGTWTNDETCASGCPEPTGRCCYGAGMCADNTPPECIALGGTWSAATTCASVPCPAPITDEIVGGMLNSSMLMPNIVDVEPLLIQWNRQHVYYTSGPVGGVVGMVEYLTPSGTSIVGMRGGIASGVFDPVLQIVWPVTMAYTDNHVYGLIGPLAGTGTSVEFISAGGPITNARGAIASQTGITGSTVLPHSVLWTDSKLLSLTGPLGGITTVHEYLTPGGVSVSGVRGAIPAWVVLPNGNTEFFTIAWTDQSIYAVIGPVGGVSILIEYPSPAGGGSIAGTVGILNTTVTISPTVVTPIRVAWTNSGVFALIGPMGGVAGSVEYLGPSGVSITGVEGACIHNPGAGLADVTVVWNSLGVLALDGPIGGATSSFEYLSPGGTSLSGISGIVATVVSIPGGASNILVAWDANHVWDLFGPVAGVTSSVEHMSAMGTSIGGVRGVVTKNQLLPGGLEPVRIAWTSANVISLLGPIGGVTSTLEYTTSTGASLINVEGVIVSQTNPNPPFLPDEDLAIAWSPTGVYGLLGPVAGIAAAVEFPTPMGGQPITAARGAVQSTVMLPLLPPTFFPVPYTALRSEGHSYALLGPVGGIVSSIEYFASGGVPLATGASNIESVVSYGSGGPGAGRTGTPSFACPFVATPFGAITDNPIAISPGATVIASRGASAHLGIPSGSVVGTFNFATTPTISYETGGMVMLGDIGSSIPLPAPTSLAIQAIPGSPLLTPQLSLTWEAVPGAASYNLYWSDDGITFTLSGFSSVTNQIIIPLPASDKKFFYVTAVQ